jgi:hypothetical protein
MTKNWRRTHKKGYWQCHYPHNRILTFMHDHFTTLRRNHLITWKDNPIACPIWKFCKSTAPSCKATTIIHWIDWIVWVAAQSRQGTVGACSDQSGRVPHRSHPARSTDEYSVRFTVMGTCCSCGPRNDRRGQRSEKQAGTCCFYSHGKNTKEKSLHEKCRFNAMSSSIGSVGKFSVQTTFLMEMWKP